ncbi:MAG: hypothetical protein U0X91_29670 [Spirosomataceae bacterium]
MNGNYKVLGVFVLIILVMFGYEKYKGQQREDAFFNTLKATDDSQQNPASQVYDPNAIINEPFGISIPVLADLKMVPSASKNSYTFIDARSGSRNDFIIVMPTDEDLNTIAQGLQAAGTPFTKTENTITASISHNGMIMNMAYNVSPNGGGISIIRWIMGTPAISQQTIDALFNGIRFREATASLAERKQLIAIDLQNQKNHNAQQTEQQQIESLRRQRMEEHWIHELNSVGDN